MRLLHSAALAVGLCAAASAFAFNETFAVSPATPRAGEDFKLTVSGATGCIPVTVDSVAVSGNRIDIQVHFASFCFGAPADYSVSRTLSVAAAGDYDVTYQVEAGPVATLGRVTVLPAAASTSLNGIWYDPAAPGSGVSVTEGANGQLFVVWFTYRDNGSSGGIQRGEPAWYMVSGGTRVSATEFRGTLHRTRNQTRELPYDVAFLKVEAIGEARLTLRPDGTLEFATTNSLTPPVVALLRKFEP